MKYFVHSPETRKTILVELELHDRTFDKVVEEYLLKQFSIVPASVQIARLHPKDNYCKKTGREVAANADQSVVFYKISNIVSTSDKTTITLLADFKTYMGEVISEPHNKLYLTKYKDSGKVIIRHIP